MRLSIRRALCALAVIAAMLQAPVSFAHEGHHHGEQAVAPLASALPRGEAVSDELELVAIARGETLEVYLDRFATNEPVTGAAIDVETPKGAARAEQGADGAYRIAAPWLAAGGRFDLIFSVSFKDVSDILTLAIEVQPATGGEKVATAAQAGGGVLAGVSNQTLLIALGAFAAGIFVAALAIRRKHAALALVAFSFLIAGAVPSRAHEGHDHSEEKRVEASSVSITSSERAQRLADGSVFAPKPVQRIFALRTLLTEKAAHPKVSELPGRIVPDPNASGYVQSAVGGRLSAPPGGFPRLGTRVKQGDILAYATPPLQAIDVSDIRQRQGELDQQISIVERRLSRFEQLTSSGAASRAQLDETRLELEGLRERRRSIETSRREPEALVAPVDGVIADGTAVAGQIVQPSSVIFHIVNPAKLWVEALSFESFAGAVTGTAATASGKNFDLTYQGAGFASRSQSVPVHFAVQGDTAGLRAGQFVTVLVATDEAQEGLALPRASLVRGANGQDMVYEHVSAERFVPRSVRAEPLDGERVLIAAGIEPGRRIVTQGAELLEHVR